MQVLEILSVSCYYGSNVSNRVLKALRSLSRFRKEPNYLCLVNAMRSEDEEVRTGILQLILAILEGCDDSQTRNIFRRELFALKFDESIFTSDCLSDVTVTGMDDHRLNHLSTSSLRSHSSLTKQSSSFSVGASPMKSDVSVVSASERSAGHIHEREPSKGRMCGTCHALKNLSQSVQLIVDAVGTGRIKQRWYVLDGRSLSWYKDEESLEESLGTLDMSDVLGIRHVSSDMRLHSDYVHSFAIETEGRVFALSCPSEDEKNDWLVALQVTSPHSSCSLVSSSTPTICSSLRSLSL